jgi:hypothetical protein
MLAHLKRRGQEPNIKLLKSAVERLTLAATQKNAGQRKDSNPDNSVNWQSHETDMLQFTILAEAVALVLSSRLDGPEPGAPQIKDAPAV